MDNTAADIYINGKHLPKDDLTFMINTLMEKLDSYTGRKISKVDMINMSTAIIMYHVQNDGTVDDFEKYVDDNMDTFMKFSSMSILRATERVLGYIMRRFGVHEQSLDDDSIASMLNALVFRLVPPGKWTEAVEKYIEKYSIVSVKSINYIRFVRLLDEEY